MTVRDVVNVLQRAEMVREAARKVLPTVAKPGHDFVLIGRVETLTRPFPALLTDIEGALRRLGAAQ